MTATSLLGGAAAGLLGQNALAAMTAAQNETLNNTCAPGHDCGENPEKLNEHTNTHQILPQSGGATDEEQAGEIIVAGKGTPPAGTPSATKSQQGLDWSIVSKSGETRVDHVIDQHGDLNLNKPNQGVFYGNPVSTVNGAAP